MTEQSKCPRCGAEVAVTDQRSPGYAEYRCGTRYLDGTLRWQSQECATAEVDLLTARLAAVETELDAARREHAVCACGDHITPGSGAMCGVCADRLLTRLREQAGLIAVLEQRVGQLQRGQDGDALRAEVESERALRMRCQLGLARCHDRAGALQAEVKRLARLVSAGELAHSEMRSTLKEHLDTAEAERDAARAEAVGLREALGEIAAVGCRCIETSGGGPCEACIAVRALDGGEVPHA